MWEPATHGEPSATAFIARSLLGPGLVGANGRLSVLDLRVWAALCARLRTLLPAPPAADPELKHMDSRTIETTVQQLAEAVYGEKGGVQFRRLRTSMLRLAARRVCVHAADVCEALGDPLYRNKPSRPGAIEKILGVLVTCANQTKAPRRP